MLIVYCEAGLQDSLLNTGISVFVVLPEVLDHDLLEFFVRDVDVLGSVPLLSALLIFILGALLLVLLAPCRLLIVLGFLLIIFLIVLVISSLAVLLVVSVSIRISSILFIILSLIFLLLLLLQVLLLPEVCDLLRALVLFLGLVFPALVPILLHVFYQKYDSLAHFARLARHDLVELVVDLADELKS